MPDTDNVQATADMNIADTAMAILSQRRYRHLLVELFKKEHRTNQQSTLTSVLALLIAASDLHRDQRTLRLGTIPTQGAPRIYSPEGYTLRHRPRKEPNHVFPA